MNLDQRISSPQVNDEIINDTIDDNIELKKNPVQSQIQLEIDSMVNLSQDERDDILEDRLDEIGLMEKGSIGKHAKNRELEVIFGKNNYQRSKYRIYTRTARKNKSERDKPNTIFNLMNILSILTPNTSTTDDKSIGSKTIFNHIEPNIMS